MLLTFSNNIFVFASSDEGDPPAEVSYSSSHYLRTYNAPQNGSDNAFYVMDVDYAGGVGSGLSQCYVNGGDNQKFYLLKWESYGDIDVVSIVPKHNINTALGYDNTVNGSEIKLKSRNSFDNNQRWFLVPDYGTGTYSIRPCYDFDKTIAVRYASVSDGEKIFIWDYNDGKNGEQPTNLKVRGFKSQFTRLSNSK